LWWNAAADLITRKERIMSEETTIVLLRMPETGEGISFREVLDNCSYTVTEAFAKLFKIAEEAGYGLRVDLPKQGEQFLDEGLWKTANRLILTPPAPEPEHDKTPSWHPDCFYAGGCGCNNIRLGVKPTPEPEPNEWEAWCVTRPMLKDYPDYHTHDTAMVAWHKRMPRCKCWKGEPE